MTHTGILTRTEIESMGPPAPEEIADTGVSEGFLCDLARLIIHAGVARRLPRVPLAVFYVDPVLVQLVVDDLHDRAQHLGLAFGIVINTLK